MPDDTDETTEALEHIAFLSRSDNRVDVLEALTETMTAPGQDTPGYEPRELQDITGASEATLSRILTGFEDRGWARRNTEGEYIATPLGQHVAVQFEPLVSSLESMANVGAAMALIPPTELSIGTSSEIYSLSAFEDVTVHRPSVYDPTPLADYTVELIRNTTTWYVLAWLPMDEQDYEVGLKRFNPVASPGKTSLPGV